MSQAALSNDQHDALQELTNIAMGQAGASLATLLDEFVDLSVPRIRMVAVVDLPQALAELVGKNNLVSAVRQSFQGYLRGEAIIIFGEPGCQALADLMGFEGELGESGENELLLDVANVLSGACLGGMMEQIRNFTETSGAVELGFSMPSVMARQVMAEQLLDPKKVPGIMYLLPCGKSPHGVDVSPDGKYVVVSGKLQGVTTVFNIEKILTSISKKDFTGDEDGIPVLKYENIKDAEVPVGLGPLHTQFGPDGYAYTSLFVDSAIAKWKLGTWEVVDKIPMSYSIGHLCAAEGDTAHPKGKWLIGLNKLSHGRHLSVGPSQPESSQLVDISDEKMKLVYDAFTEPEPHYAQMIKADKIHTIEVYPKEQNRHPLAIWDVKDAGVTRNGDGVLAKVVLVRSTITPTAIEVNQGDTVKIAMTNIEQTTDELHGFGLIDYNINIVVDPGETKTVTFKADKPGVFPYYCTNFCSALHQEMQGYLIVKPKV